MGEMQIATRRRRKTVYLAQIHEDLTKPIQIMRAEDVTPALQQSNDSYNRFALSERELQGRRVRLRVAVDVYARNRKGDLGFQRLRNKAVLLSLPSAEQAEIAIDIIRQVCASFDGKHLTRS